METFNIPSPFDDLVEKATSKYNTSEKWALILDVCAKASKSAEDSRNCLWAIIRRLNNPDADIAIQAATLLDACVSNCGKIFHIEVASRAFENEYCKLLRTCHPKVSQQLRESLKKWAEGEFKCDQQLKLIPSLYMKLKNSKIDISINTQDKKTISSDNQRNSSDTVVTQVKINQMAFNGVNINDAMLEELRCSICTEYLSCPPIQVLPNGKNICGNCRPSGCEEPGYRNVTLEAMLSNVSFPCKYQSYGCEQRLPFGEATSHTVNCELRPCPCPIAQCLWNQPIRLLVGHFKDNHPDRVLERAEFKLNVAENKEEVAMVVVEGDNFFLKYKYNAAAREFYHDVRYFTSLKELSYKIQFLNNSNNHYDYSVTAKGFQCRAYGYDFNHSQMSNGLINLGDHLTALNQPNKISVSIDLKFTRNLLRCEKCKYFLAIPVYESEGAHVCGNCCKRLSEPTTSGAIVQHVKNSLIPCRWENCEVVKKGDKIRQHEKTCENRIYYCIVPDCRASFNRFEKDGHMQTHTKYKNCLNISFQIYYSQYSGDHFFYAIIEDEIIVLERTMVNRQVWQTIKMKSTDYANNSKITTTFSHFNVPSNNTCQCKMTPEFQFNAIDEIQIRPHMLPSCFQCSSLRIDIRMQ